MAEFILMMCLIGSVMAAYLSNTWKKHPEGESSFSGVMFSLDGSTVIASGGIRVSSSMKNGELN